VPGFLYLAPTERFISFVYTRAFNEQTNLSLFSNHASKDNGARFPIPGSYLTALIVYRKRDISGTA
jgi:hypothetical protein